MPGRIDIIRCQSRRRHFADARVPPAPMPHDRPADPTPMFSLFERRLPTTANPELAEPPTRLVAFIWHFARQARGLFLALFAAGFAVALLDTSIPIFMGRIVTLVTEGAPQTLLAESWPLLLAMALVLLVFRPAAMTAQNLITNQAIAANMANRIRWQNHWYVV